MIRACLAVLVIAAVVWAYGSTTAEALELVNARTLLGAPVAGGTQVRDVLIDDAGRITHVIINPQPSIGTDDQPRQVPWSDISVARSALEVVVNLKGGGIGQVADVVIALNGQVQTVVIQTGQGTVHTPWPQLTVRRQRPVAAAVGQDAEAVVVWTR